MRQNPLPTQSDRPTRIASGVAQRQTGLSDREIELVGESYARFEERLVAMAISFCERLFVGHPDFRDLFPRGDAPKRALALSFFGFVVTNLRSADRLSELLEHMGARGLLDDVTALELDAVGRIFLATLREFEGPRWTVETAQAWALTYMWTSAAIRRGALGR